MSEYSLFIKLIHFTHKQQFFPQYTNNEIKFPSLIGVYKVTAHKVKDAKKTALMRGQGSLGEGHKRQP